MRAAVILGAGFLLAHSAMAALPEMRRESSASFAVDPAYIDPGAVQFFYELDLQNGQPDPGDAFNVPGTFKKFLPLDMHGYWQSRGEDQYYVVMSKLAYILNFDVASVTRSHVLDVKYMNAVAPGYVIDQVGPDLFHIPGDVLAGIPTADFVVDYVTPGDAEMAKLPVMDPALGGPDVVVIHHNFNFGAVLGIKTSKMAMTFSYYYALSGGRCQVVTYAYSYLYNVPPFFMGGMPRVHQEAQSHALQLIENMREYKN